MKAALRRRPGAVVFDMDGLLLDTEPLAARAWSEAARPLGVPFDAALALRMVGSHFADCSAMVRAHYPADYPVDALLAGWHAAYDAICARDGVPVMAGALDLLDWLEEMGVPRAVATSTRRARACERLAGAGLLPRFDVVVGGDEVARGKPAPDIYLEAARRLAMPPARCLALEDSAPGVRAALAAGLAVCMVPDLVELSPELAAAGALVVRSLDEVGARLAALPADD